MFHAYQNIMERCKLNYKIVKADTGAMGGSLSEEFQAITDIGEDVIVTCDGCDFSSNLEITEVIDVSEPVRCRGTGDGGCGNTECTHDGRSCCIFSISL